GALRHQQLSDLRGPSERKFSHLRIGRQFPANLDRISRDHVEHAAWNASALTELRQCQRRKWSLLCRLQDYRAAGSERRADFPRDHRQRKIPRRNAGDHSDWLLYNNNTFVRLVPRNRIPADSLRFFAEPLQKRS